MRTGRVLGCEMPAERRDYPQYTLVQRYWLPSIRAALALARKDWRRAVTELEAAATEFAKITSRPHLARNNVVFRLAREKAPR